MLVVVLNGPNLNRLGRRAPEHYGTQTLADIVDGLQAHAASRGAELVHRQSNSEGELLDFLHEHVDAADAIICNPAGLTSYGVSLRDGLADADLPLAVVHLSNFMARPAPWPREDIFVPLARFYLAGFGAAGYRLALDALLDHVASAQPAPGVE